MLKEEGYEVVLVNSNPATIMTDPEFADATYIEPLLPGPVAPDHREGAPRRAAADARRPDRAEPRQALHEDGTLEKFGVELIGADYDAIGRAEDRDLFRQTMEAAGLRDAAQRRSRTRSTRRNALRDEVGLPAIIRPAFTLGGRGGGVAHSAEEFDEVVARGARRLADRPGPDRPVGASAGASSSSR